MEMRKTGKEIADILPMVGLGVLGRFVWADTREITTKDRQWCHAEENRSLGQRIAVKIPRGRRIFHRPARAYFRTCWERRAGPNADKLSDEQSPVIEEPASPAEPCSAPEPEPNLMSDQVRESATMPVAEGVLVEFEGIDGSPAHTPATACENPFLPSSGLSTARGYTFLGGRHLSQCMFYELFDFFLL
ncbi:hypothetical protein DPX16_21353 [Anabarilius grahami]|uniref:Uncharacterized protein n=1 Tax=Anabarilius grahami TaxID=495550 RepID=A0A3N0XEN1_ANAGA|nr:hypothetical protein DPX16_21353 [Anabarilius grahami]